MCTEVAFVFLLSVYWYTEIHEIDTSAPLKKYLSHSLGILSSDFFDRAGIVFQDRFSVHSNKRLIWNPPLLCCIIYHTHMFDFSLVPGSYKHMHEPTHTNPWVLYYSSYELSLVLSIKPQWLLSFVFSFGGLWWTELA